MRQIEVMGVDSGMYYPDVYFPPVAKIDEYVAVVTNPFTRQYFQVTWLEPIPKYEKDFLVAPGTTLSDQEVKEFVVNRQEILHFRIGVDGVGRVKLALPSANKRYVLKNYIAYLEPDIAGYPNFSPQAELALLEDNTLYATLTNLSSDRYERIKLVMSGYRLVLKPVSQKPPRYAAVVVQGFGGIGR